VRGAWRKVLDLKKRADRAQCGSLRPSIRQFVAVCMASGCVVLFGCGGDSAPPTAVASFDLPANGSVPFLAVPFPSDLYLDADGQVDIGGMEEASRYVANTRIELSSRTAFCRICTITFPISGPLEPASVPADASSGATISDPVILLRADGDAGPIPLQVDYHSVSGFVVLRPAYGIVLEPGVRYVAALTDQLLATDGSPLAPSQVFKALRDGRSTDASGERARTTVFEALQALEAAGVPRQSVVAATAFTTEGDARLLREVGEVADAAQVPVVSVERVWTAGELDDLLGVPSEDRPGMDIPPEDGEGTMSIVHDAMAFVVIGTFTSPRIVSGTGTDIGIPLRDASGHLTSGPVPEAIPWVLVVPTDVPLAQLPVVLAHHGFPANKRLALRIGNTFARMGMAVLSFDAFQMGGRAASAKDEINELRGLGEPDGLPEHVDDDVSMRFLGVIGAASGEENRPDHLLGAMAQLALDAVMAIRLLREASMAPLAAAEPALEGLSFDATQVYYIGQSFGGYVGMTTLPLLAGHVQAAVPMVGPPDATENLCNSPGNRPDVSVLAPGMLGVRGPFEEAGQRLCMTPEVDLIRWLMEPFSPVHTLHFALRAPLMIDAPPPDLLFYYAEYDELLGNSSGEHVLGVAGVPTYGPTYFAALPSFDAPLSANFATPTGTITAGARIWSSDHSVIRIKHAQVGWQTPYYPPFVPLAEPRAHTNPIEDAHALVEQFFQSRQSTGRAVIPEPSSM
jgi:dienelactone hydrolase